MVRCWLDSSTLPALPESFCHEAFLLPVPLPRQCQAYSLPEPRSLCPAAGHRSGVLMLERVSHPEYRVLTGQENCHDRATFRHAEREVPCLALRRMGEWLARCLP